MDLYTQQIFSILLLSLRFAPAFAFASPFTLMRVPAIIRVLLSISLAAWLTFAFPSLSYERITSESPFLFIALGELFLGMILALTLQWAHAAVLTAGRAIDVQAGFGLALLIDPNTRGQIPLTGTLFAYIAGATFFAVGGAHDLIAIIAQSLKNTPLGSAGFEFELATLLSYISLVFVLAIGLSGVVLLTLLMIDLTVAFLSRTLPQMNVLLIGFQVKTLAVLATLPLAVSLSAAQYVRIVRLSLDTAGRML